MFFVKSKDPSCLRLRAYQGAVRHGERSISFGLMRIPEAEVVAILSVVFAFLGAIMAQLATRKRAPSRTTGVLIETETISIEADSFRLDIEKQSQELQSDAEKILTTSPETRYEVIAEVEKFSMMTEAELGARAAEHTIGRGSIASTSCVRGWNDVGVTGGSSVESGHTAS